MITYEREQNEKKLKIVIIGAGSSYTPECIEGLILHRETLPVEELYLVDEKEGKEKLQIITLLSERMLVKAGLDVRVRSTTDREEALPGADFVINQIRVGRIEARTLDEKIPLSYGMIGQETTGAGGMMCGLRTIPVVLDICRDMEKLAPEAWLVNFANPSGMITEAILKYTNVHAIGLCNAPIGVKKSIAGYLKFHENEVVPEFVGLNHLHWVTSVLCRGKECIDQLLDGKYQAYTAANVSGPNWPGEFLDILQAIPSYYLRYYYMHSEMLEEELREYISGNTRAAKVKEIEKKLFSLYENPALEEKPEELSKRGGAYYSEAAINLIDAIHNNKNEIQTVNVQNRGTLNFLPDDAVIETNCFINESGASPIKPRVIPDGITGLITCIKEYERLTIRAAITSDRKFALRAMMVHPLIPSAVKAENMLDKMLWENRKYLSPKWQNKV